MNYRKINQKVTLFTNTLTQNNLRLIGFVLNIII